MTTSATSSASAGVILSIDSASAVAAKEADAKLSEYPPNSKVTTLSSILEIKQIWLYNEWASECQFSKFIKPHFSKREELDPKAPNPNVALITSIFEKVRGQFALWQKPRETAQWKKVEVVDLPLDWVVRNIEVLYPATDKFAVSKLEGIVLWSEKSTSHKRYKLYEGNHRISAWLAAGTPSSLPATLYIGTPTA